MKIDRGSNKDEMTCIQRLTVREVLYIQQWGEGAWLTRRVARHIRKNNNFFIFVV